LFVENIGDVGMKSEEYNIYNVEETKGVSRNQQDDAIKEAEQV
jgi:hypothetical protein